MEKIGESPMRELCEIKSGISESEWIKGSREDYSHTWNQHHYQLIIENAHEAIFVAQDDRMKFVNPKTEEMSGYSRSELLTMDRMLLTHPEDREMVSEGFNRMIAGENMSHIYHHRIMDKEGNVKWVELNNEVLSPFLVTMKARYSKFTPREIEVADLIRNGKTSKEIAVLLHVTPSAVHLHRYHIRNKLGLKHRKVNLQSFLASLS